MISREMQELMQERNIILPSNLTQHLNQPEPEKLGDTKADVQPSQGDSMIARPGMPRGGLYPPIRAPPPMIGGRGVPMLRPPPPDPNRPTLVKPDSPP